MVNQLIYHLPVLIKFHNNEYIDRCEPVRATAIGDIPDEAIKKLQDTINEMIKEFGETLVFQDVNPEADVRVLEVSV